MVPNPCLISHMGHLEFRFERSAERLHIKSVLLYIRQWVTAGGTSAFLIENFV